MNKLVIKSRNVKLYHLTLVSNISDNNALDAAKLYFENKTKLSTVYCKAKRTKHNKKFSIRRGQHIGFKTVLYGIRAVKFLHTISGMYLKPHAIDTYGSLDIGVTEYHQCTLLPHNPDIPNFGFSINLHIGYPGYTVKYKKESGMKIKVLKDDILNFVSETYSNIKILA